MRSQRVTDAMGALFLSHSSLDNDHAIRVRDWLKSEGWDDVFLDLDPGQGLAPGQRWQDELKRAGENCTAVIVLISPSWVASRWCQTEFLVASQLGKRIFPVFVAPTPFDDLPLELKAHFQLADISTPQKETEGFQRLAFGLKRAGLDPKSFEWPPQNEPGRAVYRGLQPLEIQDAAIFFGRNAAITRALDDLRRLRDGAPQRLYVILGASGAGKSSFLRAGLIARLQRDESNFVVLPIVRPERAALNGAQGLAASLVSALGLKVRLDTPDDLVRAFEAVRRPVVERLRRHAEAAREQHILAAPTLIVPIDQAEELFNAENTEASAFRDLLTNAVSADGNVLIVATIRSDAYEALQNGLMPDRQMTLSLPTVAAGSYQEIIEGPARLAKPRLEIEPALTQQLLADLDAADALPLLAFALERLQTLFGKDGKLTLADYADENKLGGLQGAIQSALNAVLGTAPDKTQLDIARRLFVPLLVQADQNGVRRRVARRAEFTPELNALADRLIEQRLLISDAGNVEIAHEAILRQWPALAGWIAEDRAALIALDALRAAAQDWRTHGGRSAQSSSDVWLIHRGQRFQDARKIAARSDLAPSIDANVLEYLQACGKLERRAAFNRFAVRTSLAAAALGLLVLSVVALRSAEIARHNEREAVAQSNLAQESADFLIETFAVSDPTLENPDDITAWTILDRGVARIEANFRSQPRVRVRLIEVMARAYTHLGLIDRAQHLLEQDIDDIRATGADGVGPLLALSETYRRHVQLEDALRIANTALQQLDASGSSNVALRGFTHEAIAAALNDLGRADEALESYQRALALFQGASEPDQRSVARILTNQASTLSMLGRFDDANAALAQANTIYAAEPSSLEFAQNLIALAQVSYDSEDYSAAAAYAARGRPILSRLLGATSPTLGDLALLEGQIKVELEDYVRAAEDLNAAIAIYQRSEATRDLAGNAYYSLADLSMRQDDHASALIALDQAETSLTRDLGADHPNIGALLVQRSEALRGLGRVQEARAACVRGLAVIEAGMGANSPMYENASLQCGNANQ